VARVAVGRRVSETVTMKPYRLMYWTGLPVRNMLVRASEGDEHIAEFDDRDAAVMALMLFKARSTRGYPYLTIYTGNSHHWLCSWDAEGLRTGLHWWSTTVDSEGRVT
jgi:hypothetical protein